MSAVLNEAEIKDHLLAMVKTGEIEIVSYDETGEPQFRLTAIGKATVEKMIQGMQS